MTKSDKISSIVVAEYTHRASNGGITSRLNTLIQTNSGDADRLVNLIKAFFKRSPLFYKILCHTVAAPVVGISPKKFLREFSDDQIILNIGSGSKIIRKDVLNVDRMQYNNVDLTADAMNLPVRDNSVDCIICESLIEHTENPIRVIDEMYRVLKPNGAIYLAAPFILGFHSSPHDFYRWTDQGLLLLCKRFDHVSVHPLYGPISAWAAITSELLAMALSFNILMLYTVLYILFMTILTPLKIFDFIIVKSPFANKIALGFVVIARKGLHT